MKAPRPVNFAKPAKASKRAMTSKQKQTFIYLKSMGIGRPGGGSGSGGR